MQSNDKIGFFYLLCSYAYVGVRVEIKTDKREMYFRYKLIIKI